MADDKRSSIDRRVQDEFNAINNPSKNRPVEEWSRTNRSWSENDPYGRRQFTGTVKDRGKFYIPKIAVPTIVKNIKDLIRQKLQIATELNRSQGKYKGKPWKPPESKTSVKIKSTTPLAIRNPKIPIYVPKKFEIPPGSNITSRSKPANVARRLLDENVKQPKDIRTKIKSKKGGLLGLGIAVGAALMEGKRAYDENENKQ
jgi:hypothetical protein